METFSKTTFSKDLLKLASFSCKPWTVLQNSFSKSTRCAGMHFQLGLYFYIPDELGTRRTYILYKDLDLSKFTATSGTSLIFLLDPLMSHSWVNSDEERTHLKETSVYFLECSPLWENIAFHIELTKYISWLQFWYKLTLMSTSVESPFFCPWYGK